MGNRTVTTSTHSFGAKMNSHGFSLVEVMVALTIALLVLVAIGSMFLGAKRSYNAQERNARIQENGRFAMMYLMRDIRLAGYMGCVSEIIADQSFKNHLDTSAMTDDFIVQAQIPVEGLDASNTRWYPTNSTTLPARVAGTDAIAVRLIDPSTMTSVSSPMPNTSAEVNVTSISGYAAGDIVVISDCANADLMQLTHVQGTPNKMQHNTGIGDPGNASQFLSKPFGTEAKIMKFVTRRYYVRNNTNGVPSLYRDDNYGTPQEVVEGIESLQIHYGLDMDGDRWPDRYVRAGDGALDELGEWQRVVAVRFGILARSLDQKDTDVDNNTYDVNGKTIAMAGTDRHQRRVFLSTILLRNQRI